MEQFKDSKEKYKAFKRLFSDTEDGKNVLDYLIDTYYDRVSYTKNDKEHTFFREGQRDVVVKILRYVNKKL